MDANIINGNCAEILQNIPELSIDLTVTSPPYDDMRTYNGHILDIEAIAQGLNHVTKPGGVIVWIVADQTRDHDMSGTSFRTALKFKEAGFNLYHHMIYEKQRRQVGAAAGAYFNNFENMFVFSKGKPKTYNVIRDIKNIHAGSPHKHHKRNTDGTQKYGKHIEVDEYGKRGRIWKYSTGKNKTAKDNIAYEHPAIFPEKLAADHIKTWSNKGDMVLDPFCGSGTTLKMALHLERKCVGIDISQEYCELTARRIANIQKILGAPA